MYIPNNRISNTSGKPDPDYIWEMIVHRKVDTRVDFGIYIKAGLYTYVFDCFEDMADFERGIYAFSRYSELEIKSINRIKKIKQLIINTEDDEN